MPLSTGTALYYPYIHLRNVNDIKAALLYWDRIRRIVPYAVREGDYAHGDHDEARHLTDCGLLVSTSPNNYESAAAQTFFEHLTPFSDRFMIDGAMAREFAAEHRGIHVEKFGINVLARLENEGLAQRIGDWVQMRNEIGALYMFSLASEMARRLEAPLLASSARDKALGEAFLFESSSADASSIRTTTKRLIRLGIQLPTAQDLEHVPLSNVIEFVEKRASERIAFRRAVESVLETARSIQDEHALTDYLKTNQQEISGIMKNYHKTLKELSVGALHGVTNLTIPAGVTSLIAAIPAHHALSGVFATLGISLSVVGCWAETRGKLRAARIASPYHYLIAVEQYFGKSFGLVQH